MKMYYVLTIAFLYLQFTEIFTLPTTEFSDCLSSRSSQKDYNEDIGSEITHQRNLSFIVYINNNKNSMIILPVCSGILINSNSVLTVTSCTNYRHATDMEVNLMTRDDAVIIRDIDKILTLEHQLDTFFGGKSEASDYKLVLIKLKDPIEESTSITYAQLGSLENLTEQTTGNESFNERTCTAAGYGTKWDGKKVNTIPKLKGYNMSIVSNELCESQFDSNVFYEDSSILCGVVKEPKNTCFIETGAPLICEGKVVALSHANELIEPCDSMAYIFIPLFNLEEHLIVEEPSEGNEEVQLTKINKTYGKRSVEESESKDSLKESTLNGTSSTTVNIVSSNENKTSIPPIIETTETQNEVTNQQGLIEQIQINTTENHEERRLEERNANISVTDKTLNVNMSNQQEIKEEGIESNNSKAQIIRHASDMNNDSSISTIDSPKSNATEITRTISKLNSTKDEISVYAGSVKDERGCARAGSNSYLLSQYYFFNLSSLSFHTLLGTVIFYYLLNN